MTYRIVPRTQIGLPAVVRTAGGSPRPRLHNARFLTWHDTGVSSRGYKVSDVAREVRRIQEIFEDTKPFEYNYVIGQNEDDLIYEFAGKYAAAHSAGENNVAVGILFLNAVHEPLTRTQILKAQWTRDTLKAEGTLRANVDQRLHRWMPGASTQCSLVALPHVEELAKPYVAPEVRHPYAPEQGLWGLWQVAPKRNLNQGDVGADVQYLHDVLRLKANQEVCGDIFTQRTLGAVCNVQKMFENETRPEAGYVGPKTWRVVDWLSTRA